MCSSHPKIRLQGIENQVDFGFRMFDRIVHNGLGKNAISFELLSILIIGFLTIEP
jgi:hypothetical protein